MRRSVFTLLVVIVVLFVPFALFAGGQSEGSSGKGGQAMASKPVTLQLEHLWGGTGERTTLYDARLKTFEEKYPSIKMEITTVPVAQYQNALQVLLASNSLPNVFPWWPGGRAKVLVESNALADVTDFINTDLKGRFPAAQLQLFEYNGRNYGVPTEAVYMGTFVNSELFKQYGLSYPKTWDELLNVVKVFNQHGVVPISLAGGSNGLFIPILYQYILKDLISNQEYADAMAGKSVSQGFETAAKYLKELYDANAFEPGMLSATRAESNQLFNNGKAAIFVFGNFMIASWSPETIKRTDFVPFPTIPGGNPDADKTNVIGVGMSYVVDKGISQDAAKYQAVKTFINYMTEDSFAKDLMEKAGVLAPNTNVKPTSDKNSAVLVSMVDRFTNPSLSTRSRMMMSLTPGSANVVDKDLQALLIGSMSPAQFYQDIKAALLANQ